VCEKRADRVRAIRNLAPEFTGYGSRDETMIAQTVLSVRRPRVRSRYDAYAVVGADRQDDAYEWLLQRTATVSCGSVDRGRKRRSPSPPSEPGVRFSRDGLSSQLFPHRD